MLTMLTASRYTLETILVTNYGHTPKELESCTMQQLREAIWYDRNLFSCPDDCRINDLGRTSQKEQAA